MCVPIPTLKMPPSDQSFQPEDDSSYHSLTPRSRTWDAPFLMYVSCSCYLPVTDGETGPLRRQACQLPACLPGPHICTLCKTQGKLWHNHHLTFAYPVLLLQFTAAHCILMLRTLSPWTGYQQQTVSLMWPDHMGIIKYVFYKFLLVFSFWKVNCLVRTQPTEAKVPPRCAQVPASHHQSAAQRQGL